MKGLKKEAHVPKWNMWVMKVSKLTILSIINMSEDELSILKK